MSQRDLRASDAERDRVVDRLHKAATEGRIASDELEQRVSTVLKAQTYGELEAAVSDLPREGRHAQQLQRQRSVPRWALSTVRSNPMLLVFAIPVVAVTAALLLAATIVWSVMIIVVFILGGRGHGPRPPWVYSGRRGLRPPGRGPSRHWT